MKKPRTAGWLRYSGFSLLVCGTLLGLSALLAQAPPAPKAPPPKKPAGKGDVEIVERLLAARKEYQMTLEALRAHYIATADIERAHWAEDELIQFHRILKHPYRLELDVPPPTLDASANVPEANELYRRAIVFKDKGMSTAYIDNQRRAELLLQQLLTNYPQSDKISDAAYQLGDLYESKAFRQYPRAASYFERCFQWNPKTHFDARLRAARLYDRYLNDRNRAMEIYREVSNRETDAKRVEEAQKRLTELGNPRR
jgi:tetratricopeptide (TPR) repeat protein